MSKIKRFLKTSGVYLIGSILSKLIAFILLPLYTSKLSPEHFGTYDLVVTIVSLSIPVIFFQIWDGMFRFAFDKKNLNEKYSVVTNSFLVWVVGLVIYSIVFFIMCEVVYVEFAGLIFLYGVAIAIQYQYTFIARTFLKNKLFVISGLINSLLSASINIVLILKFNIGIESLYIAPILGCVAQVLIIEFVLHPLNHFHFNQVNIHTQREMIKFSMPLCIATISYWLLSGYTKIVISQQLGTYSNGLYAVANKFASMITLVITVFQYAWNEVAYLMSKDNNRIIKYEKSVEYIFRVIMIGSGTFMLFIKLMFPYFVSSAYWEALYIIPLSLIGVATNAFASFIGTIFMAEKQTRWIFWTTIISAVTNIIALWIVTPIWGLQGAIGSLCLAFTVLAFVRIYAIGKVFNIMLSRLNYIYVLILIASVCIFYLVRSIAITVISIFVFSGVFIYSLRDIIIPLFTTFIKRRR